MNSSEMHKKKVNLILKRDIVHNNMLKVKKLHMYMRKIGNKMKISHMKDNKNKMMLLYKKVELMGM